MTLLKDSSIVRNAAKIRSVVLNGQFLLDLAADARQRRAVLRRLA